MLHWKISTSNWMSSMSMHCVQYGALPPRRVRYDGRWPRVQRRPSSLRRSLETSWSIPRPGSCMKNLSIMNLESGGNSIAIEPKGIFVFADANTSNHESEIIESKCHFKAPMPNWAADICCFLTKTLYHQLQERAKLCPPFNLRLPRVHRTLLGPKSSSRKEELKSINKQRCSSFRFHDIGDLGPWMLHCIRIWKPLDSIMIVISETCHSVWYLFMLCPHDVLKHRFLKRLALPCPPCSSMSFVG